MSKMAVELFNMDCMEYMEGCEDSAFDLAIVDPPYGIKTGGGKVFGKVGGGDKVKSTIRKTFDDSAPPDKKYFDELIRISKNQIVFGANHFISKLPYDSSCWLVWDKDNNGDFADCELAWTSFKTAVRKIKFRWNGLLQQDMKNKEVRIHPTQKPMQLYRWILNNYAERGATIIDTHLGSASSAIAAHYYDCDFVGCEIDKDYYDAAVKRFDQETRQMALI